MVNTLQGKLDGKGRKIAIAVSRFNEHVSGKLLAGAIDMLVRQGADENHITVAWVPGAFELSLVAGKLAETGNYDAVICLGAIIRGSTPHFDYVCAQTARGIAQVGLDSEVPTIFGVLTCDTIEQAVERAGSKAGNKGSQAAMDALEMASLLDQF